MLSTAHDLEQACAFFTRGLDALVTAKVPHLVGGGYAFSHYTGIHRPLKDLDVFVQERDLPRALEALRTVAPKTEVTFPHWLGKAVDGDYLIDVIYGSGNGLAQVDEEWFSFAREANVLERRVLMVPPEEMIWSKAFVMERERCDAADVMHLVRGARDLDWERLVRRFGPHYRVLYAHLMLFGFVYPSERDAIPPEILEQLARRLSEEQSHSDDRRVCQGTLLSRAQFLVDVTHWGFEDARLDSDVHMTREQIAEWTRAIPKEIRSDE
jgi:hypothetical protein